MLCPDCRIKQKKNSKLKVMDSRPDGPYRRIRRYRCGVCGFEAWNTEALEIPAAIGEATALVGRTIKYV